MQLVISNWESVVAVATVMNIHVASTKLRRLSLVDLKGCIIGSKNLSTIHNLILLK
jgi:hypothetical protein